MARKWGDLTEVKFWIENHVLKDLDTIQKHIKAKEQKNMNFRAIIVSLIKEKREQIEFNKLNTNERK